MEIIITVCVLLASIIGIAYLEILGANERKQKHEEIMREINAEFEKARKARSDILRMLK